MFTTEEQRVALGKQVKKHEQMIAMKKRRLDYLGRDESDANFVEEGSDSAKNNKELQKALQQMEDLNSHIAKKEARNKELERTVTELDVRRKEFERKLIEVCEKNADLEGLNAELKERTSIYEAQFKEKGNMCDEQNAKVVKEVQKKVTSKCLTMDSLKENEKLVKFYTGLPDYDSI